VQFTEIEKIFNTGDSQQIEMMSRKILSHGRTHAFMGALSEHADELSKLLSMTDPEDKDYLVLVYILAQHLKEIKSGACACSIVKKPMYNSPERLDGILEILEEKNDVEAWRITILSRCLACGKEYESESFEYGHGQKVDWRELPHTN